MNAWLLMTKEHWKHAKSTIPRIPVATLSLISSSLCRVKKWKTNTLNSWVWTSLGWAGSTYASQILLINAPCQSLEAECPISTCLPLVVSPNSQAKSPATLWSLKSSNFLLLKQKSTFSSSTLFWKVPTGRFMVKRQKAKPSKQKGE